MKSKIAVSLIASSLIASFSMAAEQSISLVDGWNLVGSKLDGTVGTSSKIFKYNNTWSYDTAITAGAGFWIKSNGATTLAISGNESTNSLSFASSGWHLSSPITSALTSASFSSSDISSVYMYKNGAWLDKTKITSVEIGEGIWIKTGKDGVSLDAVVDSIVSGSVDLSGLYDANTTRTRAINPITGEVIPDSGTIQLYDINDTEYQEPLLEQNVAINPITGEYIVGQSDFKDVNKSESDNFIVRIIATKDGKNFDMCAIKTKKDSSVTINPITTAIKTQILSTLKSMFGDDLKIEGDVLDAVNLLASSVSDKVKDDIKNKKMTLRQNDFITTKTEDDISKKESSEDTMQRLEKEEKIKTQLDTSTASKDLTKFKGEVSYTKKESQDLSNIDLDNSSTNENIARLEYDMVSSLARMDFAIHDGKGRVVLFLPVPPEEFDSLPGSKYTLSAKIDGKEISIGDDPAIRVIDLSKDLKNATGDEPWSYKLVDSILESPMVPFNTVKELVKNEFKPSSLDALGELLTQYTNEYDNKIVNSNPFTPLYGKKLSSDIDVSANVIVEPMRNAILMSNLNYLQNDILINAIDNGDLESYISLFNANVSEEAFIEALADSYEFENLMLNVTIPLIDAVSPKAKEASTLIFDDNFEIKKDTTIYPKFGLALTNLVLGSSNANYEFKQKTLKDVVGDIPEIADYSDIKVWWVEEIQNINNKVVKDKLSISNDILKDVVKQLTKSDIKAEPRFQDLVTDAKNYVKKFETKFKSKEEAVFTEKLATSSEIDSEISLELLNENDEVVTEIASVKFIPHIVNIETGEIIPLTNKAGEIQGNNGRYAGTIHIYSEDIKVDANGEKSDSGKYRYISDYNLMLVLSNGESFELGHPISLYPIPNNNLNEVYVDSYNLSNPTDVKDDMPDFKDDFLISGDSLKYPLFNNMALASLDGKTLKAESGVEIAIVAKDDSSIENFWNEAIYPKPTTFVDSVDLSSLITGSLLYLKVTDSKNNIKDLMIEVYGVSNQGIDLSISPFPKSGLSDLDLKNGAPVCKTKDGTEIPLTQNENGQYPQPTDIDFPADCSENKDTKAPSCLAEDGTEKILEQNEDGSYPFPGDSNFPQECKIGNTGKIGDKMESIKDKVEGEMKDNQMLSCEDNTLPQLVQPADNKDGVYHITITHPEYTLDLNQYFKAPVDCNINNYGLIDWSNGDSIDGLALDNVSGLYTGTINANENDKTFEVTATASNSNGTEKAKLVIEILTGNMK